MALGDGPAFDLDARCQIPYKAPMFSARFFSLLCLVLVPHLLWAQNRKAVAIYNVEISGVHEGDLVSLEFWRIDDPAQKSVIDLEEARRLLSVFPFSRFVLSTEFAGKIWADVPKTLLEAAKVPLREDGFFQIVVKGTKQNPKPQLVLKKVSKKEQQAMCASELAHHVRFTLSLRKDLSPQERRAVEGARSVKWLEENYPIPEW
jgi:hypothetical protein